MLRSTAVILLAIVLALPHGGCGEHADGVTEPVIPPPNIAGTYTGTVGVRFSGEYELLNGWHNLTARGVTDVTCPQYGVHQLTYGLLSSF